MTSVAAYKRGQVEWALWRAFTLATTSSDAPPIFKTRIKRLLDLDREIDTTGSQAPPTHAYAFSQQGAEGSGIEVQYTALDALCLGVALDLLDVGFKQSEIVTLMRYLRATLEDWFDDLLERPSLIDRQSHLHKNHPHLPRIERDKGRSALADARVFLLLNRIELTEVLPVIDKLNNEALFLKPIVAEGIEGLSRILDTHLSINRRTVITVEVAALAQAVTAFLEKAPMPARGRPAKQTRNRT